MEEKIKYSKNCPKCDDKMNYEHKSTLNRSLDKNIICLKCSHEPFKKNLGDKKTRKIFNILDIEKIKKIYLEEKLSCVKIGKLFGVSKYPIKEILKKLGILRLGNSNGVKIYLTEEQEMIIKHMYLVEYKNTIQIGNKLNLSPSRISGYLVKNGYKRTINEGNFIGKIMKFHNMLPDEYLKQLPEYIKYRRLVDIITRKQPIETLINHDLRGNYKNINSYHLDHKFSVLEGFKNNINPEIIGNIKNLEFIPFKINQAKSSKCSITIEELINK